MTKENYDFIILGGGGTGLAAAMYGARLGLKTLVLGFSHGSGLPVGGGVSKKKENYKGKAILFATGTKWRKLNVPGSREFENKGVNYCALCDAPLFRGKTVG